jgi:hypothetical protein
MLLEEKILRKYIRKSIQNIKEMKKIELREERLLRNQIRKLIKESEEDVPHSSTGINVLKGLLKDIIKQVEIEYKKLTSSNIQRDSFRKHFIRATVNLLSPEFTFFDSDEKTTGKDTNIPLQEAIEVSLEDENEKPDQSMFIDIDGDGKADKKEEKKSEEAFQSIQGLDPTGRNFAMTAFDNVKQQIQDDFMSLGNEEDRVIFYNYLITNLKLHFDRMNDELSVQAKEPTTKEYEKEKTYQKKLDTGETEDIVQTDAQEEEPTPEPEDEDGELDAILGNKKGEK